MHRERELLGSLQRVRELALEVRHRVNGFSGNQQRHLNPDGMSYEQLLEEFGDGSENKKGASRAKIDALPTTKIGRSQDLRKLEKCSICIEEFQKGQRMKTLPCLHVFHDACIDKWLTFNATCPICKHVIE